MGRLLGIIARDSVPFDTDLLSAPRSLSSLSRVEPDGWGAAVHVPDHDWIVEKRALHSGEGSFAWIAARMRGTILVAHVRARTLVGTETATAPPFRRGRWVFAHEGRLDHLDRLRRGISRTRLRECGEETASELLFAHFLSRLDEAGVSLGAPTSDVDAVITNTTGELIDDRTNPGSFLLADESALYAHCLGSALSFVERDGQSVAIASEPLTNEEWLSLDEGTLIRCKRAQVLEVALLRGVDPRRASKSDVELPFTD